MQDAITEEEALAQLVKACTHRILTEGPPAVGPLAAAAALFAACHDPWLEPLTSTGGARCEEFTLAPDRGRLRSVPLLPLHTAVPLQHGAVWCQDWSPVSRYLTALGLNGLHPTRLAAVFRRLPLFAAARMPAALLRCCVYARLEVQEPDTAFLLALRSAEGIDCDALTRVGDLARAKQLPCIPYLFITMPDIAAAASGDAVAIEGAGDDAQGWGDIAAHMATSAAAQAGAAVNAAVCDALQHLAPSLQALLLHNLQVLRSPGAMVLSDAPWSRMHELHVLELEFPTVREDPPAAPVPTYATDIDLALILARLPRLDQMVQLRISGVDLRPHDRAPWAAMGRMHGLRQLHLCGCGVTWRAAQHAAAAAPSLRELVGLRHLEVLDISERVSGGPLCDWRHVLQEIAWFPLTALVFTGTSVMHVPAAALVDALADLPSLKYLGVVGTPCPHRFDMTAGLRWPEGWAAFAEQMGRLTQLRQLDMRGADAGPDAWPQVLMGLRRLTWLQVLEAADLDGFPDGLWPQVLRLLHALPQLEVVDLSHNRFDFSTASGDSTTVQAVPDASSAGPQHAQHAERTLPEDVLQLRHIHLKQCDGGVVAEGDSVHAARVLCAELLTRAPRLEQVDLRGNGFGGGAEGVFRDVLRATAPGLRGLHVS